MSNNENSNLRPADIMFPFNNRLHAIANQMCIKEPLGCGGPAKEFKDLLSQKEYTISGLCQKCQDEVFQEAPEDDAPENLGEL